MKVRLLKSKIFRYFLSRLKILFLILAIKTPHCAYYKISFNESKESYRLELFERLKYLVDEVTDPQFSPQSMPWFLPEQFKGEWAIGTLSMTGQALYNLSQTYPDSKDQNIENLKLIIEKMLQKEFREFDKVLYSGEDAIENIETLTGHIGYLTHLNLILGLYYKLSGRTEYGALGEKISDSLVRSLQSSDLQLAETYPGEIYVPDNMVVLASISVQSDDKKKFISQWMEFAKDKLLNRKTGLFNFQYSEGGDILTGPRGTGAGWNSHFLRFFSMELALNQNEKIKEYMLVDNFAFSALKEWPRGVQSRGGDIDSGPVIFGMSPAGSVLYMSGALATHNLDYVQKTLNLAEAVGTTWSWRGRKHFLLAPMVGDAIFLAMLSSQNPY